ncbi:hypothetical protein H0H87_009369, partial [Tephrocybe sp. NHM501043]
MHNVRTDLGDAAFADGQYKDSEALGDPGTHSEGQWKPDWGDGFPPSVHGVFIVTGFIPMKLNETVDMLKREFGRSMEVIEMIKCDPMYSRDTEYDSHFGYRGGMSNPQVEWVTFGTARQRTMQYPGAPIIPLGHIVLGYEGDEGRGSRPSWTRDGSFMVTRHLHTLVPEFEAFLREEGPRFFPHLPMQEAADLLGARLFGRWKDGTPTKLSPDKPDSSISGNDQKVNDFTFDASEDQTYCPFAAHIRKSNARNGTPGIYIRRQGILFGEAVSEAEREIDRTIIPRGEHFVCYASSIDDGFKALQCDRYNNTLYPPHTEATPGFDPVVGQSNKQSVVRFMDGVDPAHQERVLTFMDRERMMPPPRPPTITTLATIALSDLWDPSKELKYYLRIAERLRKDANVLYASANSTPNSSPIDREHERQREWEREEKLEQAFVKYARAATLVMERLPEHRDYEKVLTKDQRSNLTLNGHTMMELMGEIKPVLMRRVAEWDRVYGQQQPQPDAPRALPRPHPPPLQTSYPSPPPSVPMPSPSASTPITEPDLRRLAALAAAARAAASASPSRAIDIARLDRERWEKERAIEEERVRHLRVQEEGRRREEEIRRKKALERGAGREEDEIRRRQKEADENARVVRQTIETNNPGVIIPSSSSSHPQPGFLPLEPSWYHDADGDTTDSSDSPAPRHPRIEYPSNMPVPTRSPLPHTQPSQITTPATAGRIAYPQLMSLHQQRQGYQPSDLTSSLSLGQPQHQPMT